MRTQTEGFNCPLRCRWRVAGVPAWAADEGLDPDDAFGGRGDDADGQAGREGGARGGGDDPVAHRNGRVAGDVIELGPRLVVAGKDGARARVFHQHRDLGVDVGQQQKPRRTVAHFGDIADQGFPRQHRLALAHTIARTGVEQHGMAEGRAQIADDAGGDEGGVGIGHHVQVVMQHGVFGIQPPCHRLPVLQAQVFLLQTGVFGPQIGEFTDTFADFGDGGGGTRHGVEHGGDGVGDGSARAFDQDDVRLAQDHQGDGGDDQGDEGEALGQQPQRCQAPDRTGLLHMIPLCA
jgi:hypothetical protein